MRRRVLAYVSIADAKVYTTGLLLFCRGQRYSALNKRTKTTGQKFEAFSNSFPIK